VSAVESQSTAGSTVIGTSTVTVGSSDTGHIARQPPIGIETVAATNPTLISLPLTHKHSICRYSKRKVATADGPRDALYQSKPYSTAAQLWEKVVGLQQNHNQSK